MEFADINNHIREAITVIKQQGKDNEYPINLEFNESTFRVTITMAGNYQLDFTKTNFYEFLEFDKKNHNRQKQQWIKSTEFKSIHRYTKYSW